MATTAELAFADRAGSFYAREYGFPPVTGRLLGYLIVCDPAQQTIADLAEALLASRSAITGAVKSLEGYHAVRRTRAAGDRVDRISIDPAAGLAPKGFDAALYREQAELAREALDLLSPDAPAARRAVLEEAAAFYDFLARRLPEVLEEWREHQQLR
jgi:DNA-binding MarR family transcriptional regulator